MNITDERIIEIIQAELGKSAGEPNSERLIGVGRAILAEAQPAEQSMEPVALKPVDRFSHPDLADGIIWTESELRWINEQLSDAAAIIASEDAVVNELREREFGLLAATERKDVLIEKAAACIHDTEMAEMLLGQALAIQPDDEPLKQHDAALIEECAKVCDGLPIAANRLAFDAVSTTADRCAIAIRRLAAEKDNGL